MNKICFFALPLHTNKPDKCGLQLGAIHLPPLECEMDETNTSVKDIAGHKILLFDANRTFLDKKK